MSEKVPIVIVGGGVVGCAIAYKLGKEGTFVFEKGSYLGNEQSGRNSGVVHSGIYYDKNSLKSKLSIKGNKMITDFCSKYDVSYKNTGKLIVAKNPEEEKQLETLLKNAETNSIAGVRIIKKDELKSIEPNVESNSALYVPSAGIIDASTYVDTLVKLSNNKNVEFLKHSKITEINPDGDCFKIKVDYKDGSSDLFETELLINAAGLYSDEIAKIVNPESKYQINPIRGEYCKFNSKNKPHLDISHCIYPAPNIVEVNGEKSQSLGVHLTPTFGLDGISPVVLVGPTASNVDDKQNYEKNRLSESYFHEKIKDFFPNISLDDLSHDFTGIRAKLHNHDDFVIEIDKNHPNMINLIGIDSPGLTASLAIAEFVREMVIPRK